MLTLTDEQALRLCRELPAEIFFKFLYAESDTKVFSDDEIELLILFVRNSDSFHISSLYLDVLSVGSKWTHNLDQMIDHLVKERVIQRNGDDLKFTSTVDLLIDELPDFDYNLLTDIPHLMPAAAELPSSTDAPTESYGDSVSSTELTILSGWLADIQHAVNDVVCIMNDFETFHNKDNASLEYLLTQLKRLNIEAAREIRGNTRARISVREGRDIVSALLREICKRIKAVNELIARYSIDPRPGIQITSLLQHLEDIAGLYTSDKYLKHYHTPIMRMLGSINPDEAESLEDQSNSELRGLPARLHEIQVQKQHGIQRKRKMDNEPEEEQESKRHRQADRWMATAKVRVREKYIKEAIAKIINHTSTTLMGITGMLQERNEFARQGTPEIKPERLPETLPERSPALPLHLMVFGKPGSGRPTAAAATPALDAGRTTKLNKSS